MPEGLSTIGRAAARGRGRIGHRVGMDAHQALAALRLRDGIMPVADLKRLGASRRDLERMLAGGVLLKPTRGWLASPDADIFLQRAASAGVVLTCVTQAKRAGLWTLEVPQVHVAAPPNGHPRPGGALVHWHSPPIPRMPGVLVDPVENALDAVARCQPFEAALVIWESALNKRLVDRLALERLNLSAAARAVLEAATPWADSGIETIVVSRLRWLGLRLVPQAWIAGHRVDVLIGDCLVIQIDGKHHVGAQRASDIAHDAELMQLGYHVIRVGYFQVIDDWPAVQHAIMRAVAQGLHRRARV